MRRLVTFKKKFYFPENCCGVLLSRKNVNLRYTKQQNSKGLTSCVIAFKSFVLLLLIFLVTQVNKVNSRRITLKRGRSTIRNKVSGVRIRSSLLPHTHGQLCSVPALCSGVAVNAAAREQASGFLSRHLEDTWLGSFPLLQILIFMMINKYSLWFYIQAGSVRPFHKSYNPLRGWTSGGRAQAADNATETTTGLHNQFRCSSIFTGLHGVRFFFFPQDFNTARNYCTFYADDTLLAGVIVLSRWNMYFLSTVQREKVKGLYGR